MKTTITIKVPPYIGADLSDRHARRVRPIDVCGLRLEGTRLVASFWQWRWTPAQAPIDVTALLPELRQSRSVMIDGPQGLARRGCSLRVCERRTSAAGKTGDDWPVEGRPFAGFVRSSLELFEAIAKAGIPVSPSDGRGACEVYPAAIWKRLANRRLPHKKRPEGRAARRGFLEQLGVTGLPGRLNDDHLDAAVSAVIAAGADGAIPGLTVEAIGEQLLVDEDGTLREGPMFVPVVTPELERAINVWAPAVEPDSRPRSRPRRDPVAPRDALLEAEELLETLLTRTVSGQPTVCSYGEVASRLLGCAWSRSALAPLIRLARSTRPRQLPGLGPVRLDTFIVQADSGRPGMGHWKDVDYGPRDWDRVFAVARFLATQ